MNTRQAQHPASMPKADNMIAVASGKGGVGKTWFSCTLSHALSMRGNKTLLFDGDLGLANVDIQLGLMPKQDIGNVIAGRATLRDAVTPSKQGFDVIAGKSGSGILSLMKKQQIAGLRNDLVGLASDYKKVIVDLGAGLEPMVQILAMASGTLLVVTSDEPTSITDAYALIKMIARRSPKMDIRIVVNSADSHRSGQRTYATLQNACRNFLKMDPPLAGVIRRDTKVKDSIRAQMGILDRHPTSQAGSDVMKLSEGL